VRRWKREDVRFAAGRSNQELASFVLKKTEQFIISVLQNAKITKL
jgi:hypothetical protein